jgi:hypothetical protein
VVRGADEVFWVPTLEQALEMAKVTGKPLFLMGYSLVGRWQHLHEGRRRLLHGCLLTRLQV